MTSFNELPRSEVLENTYCSPSYTYTLGPGVHRTRQVNAGTLHFKVREREGRDSWGSLCFRPWWQGTLRVPASRARLLSPGRQYRLRVILPSHRGFLTAGGYDGGASASWGRVAILPQRPAPFTYPHGARGRSTWAAGISHAARWIEGTRLATRTIRTRRISSTKTASLHFSRTVRARRRAEAVYPDPLRAYRY